MKKKIQKRIHYLVEINNNFIKKLSIDFTLANHKKISQVLIESDGVRKQTTGLLFYQEFNSDEHRFGEILEYCALGALACEAGIVNLDSEASYKAQAVQYAQILDAYDIKNELEQEIKCKICKKEGYHFSSMYLSKYIIHLNDSHQLSFKGIGDEMQRLGY